MLYASSTASSLVKVINSSNVWTDQNEHGYETSIKAFTKCINVIAILIKLLIQHWFVRPKSKGLVTNISLIFWDKMRLAL